MPIDFAKLLEEQQQRRKTGQSMVLIKSVGTSAEGESPAMGSYTMELVSVTPIEEVEKSGFKEGDPPFIALQSIIGFKFIDYPYDPQSDTKDWEGVTITGYFTFQKKFFHKDRDGNVVIDKVTDSYFSKLSPANWLISAVLGRQPTREDEIDLDSYIGTRFDVGIEPKDNGWHSFKSFAKKRATRVRQPQQEAAPTPAQERITRTGSSLKGTTFDVDEEDE